jgi:pyrroloquinoline quinone (PQQ) biosynthesis protein C
MPFFERLVTETAAERDAFIAIPVIQRALAQGVPRAMYIAFLEQAYHHVKHTCLLLSAAAARCGTDDPRYVGALLEYIAEERGHEEWILNDITALGGNAEAVRDGEPQLPARLLVAYVYYAIDHISPYAMLGMVHVLEGMSAAFATAAASSLKVSLGVTGERGFSYLSSHGRLDQDHTAFFRELVEGINDASGQRAIIDTACVVYRLYGDIFRDIDTRLEGDRDAA